MNASGKQEQGNIDGYPVGTGEIRILLLCGFYGYGYKFFIYNGVSSTGKYIKVQFMDEGGNGKYGI